MFGGINGGAEDGVGVTGGVQQACAFLACTPDMTSCGCWLI